MGTYANGDTYDDSMTAGAADPQTFPIAVFTPDELREFEVGAGQRDKPVLTSISPASYATPGTSITATGTGIKDGTKAVFLNADSEIIGVAEFVSGNGSTTAVFAAPGDDVVELDGDPIEMALITGGGQSTNTETLTRETP